MPLILSPHPHAPLRKKRSESFIQKRLWPDKCRDMLGMSRIF